MDKLLTISGGQVLVKNIRFTGVKSTTDGAVVVQEVSHDGYCPLDQLVGSPWLAATTQLGLEGAE